MNRREFMMTLAISALSAMAGKSKGETAVIRHAPSKASAGKTIVSLIKTGSRREGIGRAISLLGINPVKGRAVLLKPNFNTADEFPGSTHNDTLEQLILELRAMGAKTITLGERSGPPHTADVMREKAIYDLCARHDVPVINFEDLPPTEWVRIKPEGTHWRNGFLVARPIVESPCVVTTCCLKTHGYGGVFTMSLKLSVGITHKKNMSELHTSFLNMCKMIAEINTAYQPSLILLDGLTAFTDRGPSHGTRKEAGVILAGTDRIAIDAVGLAILKDLGSTKDIMTRRIFEQEQISRAVELDLGVARPQDIEIIADDENGRQYAGRLHTLLAQG